MILAVSGHRPPSLGGYIIPNLVYSAVVKAIDIELMRQLPDSVLTGMALGVDQWTAEICLANDIPYTAVIPFDNFEQKWPAQAQARYRELLRAAESVVSLAPTPSDTASYATIERLMHERNEYLVRHSDRLLAVYSGSNPHSGTAHTVNFAMRQDREVFFVQLPPDIWALAATIYEREQARRSWRDSQSRQTAVGDLRRRLPAVRFDPEQEEFIEQFPSRVDSANREKQAEKIKEDVAHLKPRRIIEI